MYKYLKDNQYYIDLYDLHTIEKCLDYYQAIKNGFTGKRSSEEFKQFSDEEFNKEIHKTASFVINFIKSQHYKNKKQTIQEWINRDSKQQQKIDNAVPPQKILCKQCSTPTEFIFKELHYSYEENSKVLFIFECPKCKKRQALYDDGTEWQYKASKCPECNSTLNRKSDYFNNILTTIYSCSNCSYKTKEIDDFNKDDKEREEREAREKELLEKYREEFCDDKTGQELSDFYDKFFSLMAELKEKAEKNKDPMVQEARQLKKLTIAQLERLIGDTIKKEGYKDLKFGKPEMNQYVIVDFSVIDTKEDRKEYNSRNILKKLIKGILKDTNWRLMSEGIDYRLGFLAGRLKAYEREEDLIELIGKEKALI